MNHVLKHSIRLLALAALFAPMQGAYSQAPDTIWTSLFGGTSSDFANDVVESTDGGFMVAGESFSFGPGLSDAWLLRVTSTGDTLWTKTYGTAGGYESANAISPTSDGGYVMVGSVFDGVSNALLVRTDADGNEVWSESYGWFGTDTGSDVLQTPDGGFIFCGTTRSFHSGFGSSVWLLRTDADGDSLWSRVYGGSSYQDGHAIALTPDDGFIVAGSYNDGGAQSTDAWLLRTDAAGDTLWTRKFGGVGGEDGRAVVPTSDGGFMLATTSYAGGPKITLIRTDANGDSLWTSAFIGSIEGANSLVETSDGGFFLTGGTESGDVMALRTDANGDLLWTATYGGMDADGGHAALQTDDGGYIVAGLTDSYGSGQTDGWLIRFVPETATYSEGSGDTADGFRLHPNYPNPFSGTTTINYMVNSPASVRMTVLNLLGQEVRVLANRVQPVGAYSLVWDGRDDAGTRVSSGVYLYRLNVDGSIQTRKMLLVR